MMTDRVHKIASKQVTGWSKFQLPGYWVVLQVLVVVAFAVYLVGQAFTGGSDGPGEAGGIPSFEERPGQVGGETAALPVDPPSDGLPGATTGAPVATGAPGAGEATSVVDVSGVPVDVPDEAARVAVAGLRANYDPAVAATVPVAGGGTVPAPARAFPDATVGALVFVSKDGAERLVFAAATDADGAGSTFGSVTTTITVYFDGSSWSVERA